MLKFENRATLQAHVLAMHQPSPEEVLPPEYWAIQAAVGALHEGGYALYDPEGSLHTAMAVVPGWVPLLPSATVALWDGSAPGSWGYGNIDLLTTPEGPGLEVSLGGSHMQSAGSFLILPLGAVELAQRGLEFEAEELAAKAE